MSDILDLIDHAMATHSDAMRWVPDDAVWIHDEVAWDMAMDMWRRKRRVRRIATLWLASYGSAWVVVGRGRKTMIQPSLYRSCTR